MNHLRVAFAPYWQSIQHALFPQLERVLGPLTEKQQQLVVGHPQELIISRHSSTDPVDDDAVAGRRHGWGLSGDGVCAAAG